MQDSILNVEDNLAFNRKRWGELKAWQGKDQYGYRWGGGYQQNVGQIAEFADRMLRPHTGGRYDLNILELSPGGGRFTAELIRFASRIDLLDMNAACLDICRERLKFYPIEVRYFQNDGQSCDMLDRSDYDLIACYDSMVHMHPDIIEGYVTQLGRRLASGGVMWLDHSGKGARDSGHRTDMTPERMASFAAKAGLQVVSQEFRNASDCISVLRRS